jgi:hypothetical protein
LNAGLEGSHVGSAELLPFGRVRRHLGGIGEVDEVGLEPRPERVRAAECRQRLHQQRHGHYNRRRHPASLLPRLSPAAHPLASVCCRLALAGFRLDFSTHSPHACTPELAMIKEAKKIRATLAVQNELSDPDNIWHMVVIVMWVGYPQTTRDVPVQINEHYGETVPANSEQHMKLGHIMIVRQANFIFCESIA